MNKKFLVLFVVLLLVGFVSAVTIGTIFTQAQLDAQDLDTYDFETAYLRKALTEEALVVTFGMKTLEKLDDGTYEVVGKTADFVYWKDRYYNCRQDNNKEICIQKLKDNVIERSNNFVEEEREKLKDWQTKSTYDTELEELDFE